MCNSPGRPVLSRCLSAFPAAANQSRAQQGLCKAKSHEWATVTEPPSYASHIAAEPLLTQMQVDAQLVLNLILSSGTQIP